MDNIVPIVDNENENEITLVEENTEVQKEESFPIIRPTGKRTNINELIEKQNSGLDAIRKMSELSNATSEDLNNVNSIVKEISENAVRVNDDITMIKDVQPEVNIRTNDMFDYNAPISSNAGFASKEDEKAIIENLNDTLKSIEKTKEQAKEVVNNANILNEKKEEVIETPIVNQTTPKEKEIIVIEEKEVDTAYTLEVSEDDVIKEEKVEVTDDTPKMDTVIDKPKPNLPNTDSVEEDGYTLEKEDDDSSLFSQVETLLEEDLDNISKDTTTDIVVPLSDYATIIEAVIDSDPGSYQEVVRNNPKFRPFVNKLRSVILNQKSFLHRVHRANELFYTAQQNFNRDALEEAVKRNNNKSTYLTGSAKIKDKVIKDILADKEDALRRLDNNVTIKGNLAVKTAVLLTQGIKRIQLFNSGFNIAIRAPKLSELADFWRESTSDQDEYGRQLGQLSYLPADAQYKHAAMDLVEKLVVDSNLINFDTPGELKKAISYLDFDTVMWAIVSLMFPKGIEVDFICHNGTCRYQERNKISVSKMRYNDWSLLTSDDILYTISNTKRSLDDLEKYRENIKNKNIIKKINDEWSAIFRIPTMYEIEEAHLSHIADITKKVQLTSLQDASAYVAVKYYGILAPFTEKLVYRSPESGKIINIAGDKLSSALEALQSDNDIDFAKTVNKFIADTKITHICFTFNKCPKCGELPTSAVGHLIPCDVHKTFFTWMARYLNERV